MTPNPDCVSADLTVLDALREMHDHKYLHLPVRDEDGSVLGVVDVMELVSSAAGGESGSKGWRDFFNGGLQQDSAETVSQTSSLDQRSANVKGGAASRRSDDRSRGQSGVATAPSKTVGVPERPVSKLRPKKPVTVSDESTCLEVAQAMAASRADAALLISARGTLTGILTDNDVTRRVVAPFKDINACVSEVMTKGPKCVRMEDSALDALEMMVENRFRHLPVLDADGAVVGLLDIAKCLYDTISALEKAHESGDGSSSGSGSGAVQTKIAEAMVGAMKKANGSNKAQLAAMQALMESMFGGSMPTLRTILSHSKFSFVVLPVVLAYTRKPEFPPASCLRLAPISKSRLQARPPGVNSGRVTIYILET
jgi:CBS domain-containing protein